MIFTDSPDNHRNEILNPAKDQSRIRKHRGSTATQLLPSRWRNSNQNRIYSAKLYAALRRIRRTDSPMKPNGRSIREAADRALAVTAGGRTRWSKAILSGGRSTLRKNRRIRPAGVGERRSKLFGAGRRGGTIPAVERKVKFLGRLVPGCRKLSLSSVLEEAADYIAAVEMQVRAMTSLAEKLSGFAGVPVANAAESASGSPIPS
ncbi:transcription factor bHLH149-like [Phalaenopsis equestris]|uniref:transcription factor bHLH149-like n=1 Tax=Phalaenopsis equestris TaxID=78828 RepID=UPI0009E195E5|nr:transcription factor bHLH149-like [Phalaenopsis equestris]